jgi:hypothetical protein
MCLYIVPYELQHLKEETHSWPSSIPEFPDSQSLVDFLCTSIVSPIYNDNRLVGCPAWLFTGPGLACAPSSRPSSSSAVHQECSNANLFHSVLLSSPTELLTLKSYVHMHISLRTLGLLTKLSLQPTQSHCSLSLETKPTRADLQPKTLISTSTFDL